MAEWSLLDRDWPLERPYDSYSYSMDSYYAEKPPLPQSFPPPSQQYVPPSPTTPPSLTLLLPPPQDVPPAPSAPACVDYGAVPRGDNPREIRNKAEKQRRDKLNHSISELASMVPPVVAASRKVDKTGVLRLTAHYLRAHQYVFGDSINNSAPDFKSGSAQALLGLLRGFLLTTTYKGIVVVVSQNVKQYLGYTELDLLGHNIFSITHPDDEAMFKEQLMPPSHLLGPHGELLVPNEQSKLVEALTSEKKKFVVRLKKNGQRSEPAQYVTFSVEGTLRKSDRACRGYNRCCQMVRRARARGDNPCSSGNDVVFVGMARPMIETFMSESGLESFKMEYRTRHSIDGEIIQCEQRIALVTGYMTHEVNGVNAMNFMHRDDVRWVIVALREMYDHHRLLGESCYRLMTKNGQFIYMRTIGQLDVDENTRAVRSFVCTNTVVDEEEGKQLIKQMKKKLTLMINDNEEPPDDEFKEVTDSQAVPVEDPRQLEKVILHLVTNLPSPAADDESPGSGQLPPLSIIPPKREKIVSAIDKIYSVLKYFHKDINAENVTMENNNNDQRKISEIPSDQTERPVNIADDALLAPRPSEPAIQPDIEMQLDHQAPTYDMQYNDAQTIEAQTQIAATAVAHNELLLRWQQSFINAPKRSFHTQQRKPQQSRPLCPTFGGPSAFTSWKNTPYFQNRPSWKNPQAQQNPTAYQIPPAWQNPTSRRNSPSRQNSPIRPTPLVSPVYPDNHGMPLNPSQPLILPSIGHVYRHIYGRHLQSSPALHVDEHLNIPAPITLTNSIKWAGQIYVNQRDRLSRMKDTNTHTLTSADVENSAWGDDDQDINKETYENFDDVFVDEKNKRNPPPSTSGTKRQHQSLSSEQIGFKKAKSADVRIDNEVLDVGSASQESAEDDFLNINIMGSIEENVLDPTFPGLLYSNEVQDMLTVETNEGTSQETVSGISLEVAEGTATTSTPPPDLLTELDFNPEIAEDTQ